MLEEKERRTKELWRHLLDQTQRIRESYPALALGGRPLLAGDEVPGETSIETYQVSELLTYSEKTLQALLDWVVELEGRGVDLAYQIQENSVTYMGYASMDEAEKAMAWQFIQQLGGREGCCGCRMPQE